MKTTKSKHRTRSALDLARFCARTGLDKKAEEIVILDVRAISSFADYFVIMSGRSTRHVQGLAEAIEAEMEHKRKHTRGSEGLGEGLWVLLDYNEVIVHIFYRETREFYDLEGLWHDAPRVGIEDRISE